MIQSTISILFLLFGTAYPKPRCHRIEVDTGHLTPIEIPQSCVCSNLIPTPYASLFKCVLENSKLPKCKPCAGSVAISLASRDRTQSSNHLSQIAIQYLSQTSN
ncbi:hypothetical protein QL093DRAFT_1056830 [Fusarium oxysporum]|nr:hypothetical protein QL093DRAFT_1056830 [Fusarium oxysporum]